MAFKSELGSIIAFEGRSDLILTQLRLLPPSSQLLVLPNVKSYLARQSWEQTFDARVFVLQVNKALAARLDAAHSFLNGSMTGGKRLVFMDGGTAGAQALCVKALMKHETAGDQAQAFAMFDDLVRHGRTSSNVTAVPHCARSNEPGNAFEDAVSKAMRAAEALDRQTANLQPSYELDLSTPRQRSASLPLYKYSDAFGDGAPFFVFGAPGSSSQSLLEASTCTPKSPDFPHNQRPVWHDTAGLDSVMQSESSSYSPSCIGETYAGPKSMWKIPESGLASPALDGSFRHDTDDVVYSGASLLSLRPPTRSDSLVRVRSLDTMYLASPKFRDAGIPSVDHSAELDQVRARRCRSELVVSAESEAHFKYLGGAQEPRTITVRSRIPVVRVAPVPQSKKNKYKQRIKANNSYVDRGTDAESCQRNSKTPFHALLEHTEDLVVLFKEEHEDKILQSIIDAFKTGNGVSGSPTPDTSTKESTKDNESPDAVTTPTSEPSIHRYSTATSCADTHMGSVLTTAEEYDPFAYTKQPPSFSVQSPVREVVVRPPTPAQTPPPTAATPNKDCKFKDFKIESSQTAVAVQNSLRSLLSMHFPSGSQGYHQFQFSVLPELDGLWKPIFHATEPHSPHKTKDRIHQILAIGSQKGVKKEYSLAITGQLERLGSTPGQQSRADRLDFRYLLANAMQSFTSQPLAKQTCDNPFAIPYLLATLIVPHLETYLALHPEIRYLLLQYSPEHLEAVLALQKLVGVDLLKVAQIVDSDSKEQLPFTHVRGASISKKFDKAHNKTKPSAAFTTSGNISVSKANYLLTSTASDREIAKFVSAVWSIPVDTGKQRTLSSRESNTASSSVRDRRKGSVYTNVATGLHSRPDSGSETLSSTTPPSCSIDSVIRTSGQFSGIAESQTDASSVTTGDLEDDSDFDQEERRLMPLYMPREKMVKRSSRKALKFLGLA